MTQADILLIACITTTLLAKYPHILYAKPLNKVYTLITKETHLNLQDTIRLSFPCRKYTISLYSLPIASRKGVLLLLSMASNATS